MPENTLIPMFPLSLLPLPGELVPLHIFEPRYRQLLTDAESLDVSFGIYCSHEVNKLQLGSVMKLESVIKRYSTGESDIVVRCTDIITVDKLYRTYKTKLYPGGDVLFHNTDVNEVPGVELHELFLIYQTRRNLSKHYSNFSIYHIAQQLNLDLPERYKFLSAPPEKRSAFLTTQLKFQLHVIRQEEKSKDLYHLN